MASSVWKYLSQVIFGLGVTLAFGSHAYCVDPATALPKSPASAIASDGAPASATYADCYTGNCSASENCLRDCLPCNYFANNGWYVGAEYLYLRENISEPVAAVRRTVTNDGNTSTILDESQAFDFDYNSTFRINGGFRCGECCGEALNFSYFHYGNSAFYAPNPICNTICHIYAGQLGNNADGGGERFLATYDTNINTYDLDYSKRIPICSCNSNPCDCCQCPPWAITWSAGLRVLDFSRREANAVFAAGGALASTGEILTDFNGVGPKVSVDGRRYFGETRCWSFYSKGSLALLLGDYETRRTLVDGAAIGIQTDEFRRVIPMTEIEFGLSRQIGEKTLLTVGYFLQAYWDLGMFENIEGTNFGAQDDANILAFDGLMFRVEHTF